MSQKPLLHAQLWLSEGRRTDVIDAIQLALARAGGVYLLDTRSDSADNRTQITLAGLPTEIEKSILGGMRAITEHLNLQDHSGDHPRFGALDRVLLMPLRDLTLETCIKSAHHLGQRLATLLPIPIYFYDYAALRPQYRDADHLCRADFQYEHLREQIAIDPHWMPDCGPAQLGIWGATLIGASPRKIQVWVELDTSHPLTLNRLAQAVMSLREVKASFTPDQKFLTLTLSDADPNLLPRVLEVLRLEADRCGVRPQHSGFSGLVPRALLLESAAWYLQLDPFSLDQILEDRLARAEAEQIRLAEEEPPIPDGSTAQVTLPSTDFLPALEDFTSAIAQATITPGGGSVGALAGALAAALASMVSGLTLGRRGYEAAENTMLAIQATAHNLRIQMLKAVDKDTEAFQRLMDAMRLPQSEPQREAIIQGAALNATDTPLEVARQAYAALQLLGQVARLGNRNALIDGVVGVHMAVAAIESAALNVRINLISLNDQELVQRYSSEIQQLTQSARQLSAELIQVALRRTGLLTEDTEI